MLPVVRLTSVTPGLFHPDQGMSGSQGNGSTAAADITGRKDPGSGQGRAGTGNPDTGKVTARVTDGIRANGSNPDRMIKNEKSVPLKA